MTHKILLVDDDPLLADGLREILSLYGYCVDSASCAEDALQLIHDDLPHLIVSDYLLRGMTGIEFATVLKGHEETVHIPFLLLTGMHPSQLSGVFNTNNIIQKPFEIEAFISQIKNYLSDNYASLG
ncbi:MAG: response regulator [Chloroflexota bacterium]